MARFSATYPTTIAQVYQIRYLENALEVAAIVESLAKNGRQFTIEIGDGLVELGTVYGERFVVWLERVVCPHRERNEQLLELFVHVDDPGAEGSAENPADFYLFQLGKFHHGVK